MWRLAGLCAALALLGCLATAGADDDGFLAQQSLLYALAAAAPPGKPATSCSGQLEQLRHAADRRHVWALKMLDASGTPGSAFLWGNNYWLGSRSQCETIPLREPLVLSRPIPKPPLAWPPYPIRYSVASFRHNASLQVHVGLPNEDLIIVGLCLPASCSAKEVAELLDAAFLSNPMYIQKMYNMSFSPVEVESLKEDDAWVSEQSFVIVEALLTFVAVFAILGTAYDVIIWQPHLRKIMAHETLKKMKVHNNKENMEVAIISPKISENNNDSSNNNNNYNINNKSCNFNEKTNCYTSKSTLSTRGKIVQAIGPLSNILVCFSIYSNVPIILDTQLSSDSVPAIHGLRFMGMGWIIMVHTVFYLSDYADNKPQAFYLSEGFMVQVVSNSTLSVDTFFFLSGFLVSYLYYQGKQGKKPSQETCGSKILEFISMVLRRIIRLTPAYMAVIGIAILNMKWHSQKTVFHMTERADIICSKYWWRNLLYINNLFDREEMCLSWSWYLSNDMQFFIIASFLLILSSSYFLLSVVILVSLIVTSSAVTFYSSYINSYIPMLDQQFAMLSTLYDPPWTRIGPHLVGVATGYIVVYLKGKLVLKKRTLLMAWLLGSSFNVATLFGLYNRNISVTAAALYVALSRTAWALGISWIIIACCTNNAGIINSILSFRGWVPLSRLTYCVYLLNPLLMNSIYLDSETAMHVEFLPLAAYFFGHVGVSFFCAFVLSLTCETPNVLIMRWLLGSQSKSQKASTSNDSKATSV